MVQLATDLKLDVVLDQQRRDLVRAWAHAWDEVAGDLRDTIILIATDYDEGDPIPKAAFARSTRLAQMLTIVGARLTTLADDAGVRVIRDLSQVVKDGAGAQRDILSAMLPDTYRLPQTRVDSRALDEIVKRATEQITSPRWRLSEQAYDGVRRELIRGIAVGSGPRQVAARMVDRAEGEFNGGLARATNIARTELVDAHRQAAGYGQKQHADILTGWVWLTHLTATTCRSCIGLNGTVHDLDEPGPLDHQSGRCSRMPKTKTYAELGIDLPEPEPSGLVDTEAWFAALSESEQRGILGPKGWAAWRAGDYPMSDWSTKRTTDGWRDSFAPSTPPA